MTCGAFASFGTVLKEFRTRRELTQQTLAEKLGVRRNTVGSWERGDFLPQSKGMVLELARHLHLDDEEIRQLLEASLTLAPYWSVPLRRNPYFTGREEILEALHMQLGVDQTVALTQSSALHGLGGIGKTQIALEYAYRHALEYSAVFWITAEIGEQIVASLLRIAETLLLPEREDSDLQHVVAAVQRWLSTHEQWLLIWDNVEDLTLLDRFLPATRSGAVLLTTSRQAQGTLARGLCLLPMEQDTGVLLLLRRAKVLEAEATSEQMHQFAERMPAHYAAAADLVTELGGLPLALDQAGAYLEETRCGPLAYLTLFRARRSALLQRRGEEPRDHPASAAATFTLAVEATARHHSAVRNLLQVCTLLQPDAIPEELFRQGGQHLGPQLQNVCCDPLEWDHVVGIACSSSLLSRQPEAQTLSLHRLVQAILLDEMTEVERGLWDRRVIEALEAVFPQVFADTEYTVWKRCERLLPHTFLFLDREQAADPLVFASLASKIAQYLYVRGRYTEAEPLGQRALSIRERVLGSSHVDVAASLQVLAEIAREQGQPVQAEALFLRARQIWEHALGPDHPDVARSLTGLALLYWLEGRYAQAHPLFRRASQIWKQTLGPDHPRVGTSFYYQAEMCQERGMYGQAEALFLRARQIWEQALGPDHPHVAFSLTGLAWNYATQRKDEQAEALFLRARQIWEHALGPDHPHVAYPLTDLASLDWEQGKDLQAEALFLRARQIREQALGPDHPDVASSLTDLAELYATQGKDGQAEALFQRACQILKRAPNPDHPHAARPLNSLANLSLKQGKNEQAERLFQRALALREHGFGL
jgi:tetratricopeptide (TPR) repeat protein/transcriptional regulator with XRE-family HTH domain